MIGKAAQKTKHLYARAGFGIQYAELARIVDKSAEEQVDELFRDSDKADPITIVDKPASQKEYRLLSPEERREQLRSRRLQTRHLNIGFLNRLSTSKSVLREKMTLFFHGHFACRSPQNPYALQELNNIHRQYAFGNFKTLTKKVSQSQAMLAFLNNQQNRKGSPNENFARELMELFTLGRQHYTENDVKESARAFTGWMYDREGSFVFRPRLHDTDAKVFFGQKGNFDGDDILRMIFEKREAAHFLVRKLYKFFVNELPDESRVKQLGDYFYDQNYELEPLLRKMFTADWFYDEANVGNKIKSPVELIIGLNRQFYVDYENPGILFQFQQALGQTLFYPPNVAGWNEGKNYIDSSSLMVRLKIPSTVLNNGVIEFEGKIDPDDEAYIALAYRQSQKVAQRIQAKIDWEKFESQIPKGIDNRELAGFLLQPKISRKLLNDISVTGDLKARVVQMLSTPEYQLC